MRVKAQQILEDVLRLSKTDESLDRQKWENGDIIAFLYRNDRGEELLCFDYLPFFNKEGQMPICAKLPANGYSKRQCTRLLEALNFVVASGRKGVSLFEAPGFDDLGQWNRDTFYI